MNVSHELYVVIGSEKPCYESPNGQLVCDTIKCGDIVILVSREKFLGMGGYFYYNIITSSGNDCYALTLFDGFSDHFDIINY